MLRIKNGEIIFANGAKIMVPFGSLVEKVDDTHWRLTLGSVSVAVQLGEPYGSVHSRINWLLPVASMSAAS